MRLVGFAIPGLRINIQNFRFDLFPAPLANSVFPVFYFLERCINFGHPILEILRDRHPVSYFLGAISPLFAMVNIVPEVNGSFCLLHLPRDQRTFPLELCFIFF